MIATAKLKYLGVSAQKVRLVVDQVRGRTVGDALAILKHSPKLVSRDLEKLLNSAVANAEQKDPGVDVDELVVAQAMVDEAPPMKRAISAAQGRVHRRLKRACHVKFHLDTPAGKARG